MSPLQSRFAGEPLPDDPMATSALGRSIGACLDRLHPLTQSLRTMMDDPQASPTLQQDADILLDHLHDLICVCERTQSEIGHNIFLNLDTEREASTSQQEVHDVQHTTDLIVTRHRSLEQQYHDELNDGRPR